MELSRERPEGIVLVRHVAANHIVIDDRELEHSFLLVPERAIEDWPVDLADKLDAGQVAPLLDLQPEVILLGTGTRQVFPPAEFLAGFLRKGIGIEVMDNSAAARTYNLLAGEGRKVLAAFILPGQSASAA
ncbi:MAG: Mth938-like domain-containing protein [Xanthomonadales bacterium]|nr:Mth938-like domain-containing protein [Xanthomonadales bacterium]